MSRVTRPEVSNAELRAALDRVGPHIENYNENLDLISNDIRAIEQYLTASGVRHCAAAKIGEPKSLPTAITTCSEAALAESLATSNVFSGVRLATSKPHAGV
jgi:hypothetical protein